MRVNAGSSIGRVPVPAHAQWLSHPNRRAPRSNDGKPNWTTPAPRLNGKRDLPGLWQAERTLEREYARVLGNGYAALQIEIPAQKRWKSVKP